MDGSATPCLGCLDWQRGVGSCAQPLPPTPGVAPVHLRCAPVRRGQWPHRGRNHKESNHMGRSHCARREAIFLAHRLHCLMCARRSARSFLGPRLRLCLRESGSIPQICELWNGAIGQANRPAFSTPAHSPGRNEPEFSCELVITYNPVFGRWVAPHIHWSPLGKQVWNGQEEKRCDKC